MKIVFLGTGTSVGVPAIGCDCKVCQSADPCNKRTRTSALLTIGENNILIDASIDLRQQALREGIRSLSAVLLTHGHADHVFGLDDIRIFNFRQQSVMPVHGSSGTLADVARTFWYVFEHPPTASSRPQIRLREIDGPFRIGAAEVVPFTVLHGDAPILGYRFGRIAYITDASRIPEETVGALGDLDVLVINALRRKSHPTHFNLEGALAAIEAIRPRRTYLTHLSHDFDHSTLARDLPAGVAPAYDGLSVEVADD